MELYFLRHGEAEHTISNDRLGPLSQEGKESIRKVGEFLRFNNIKISKILISPLLRAYQTAQIVSKLSSYPDDEILESDELLPENSSEKIFKLISEINGICFFEFHTNLLYEIKFRI